MEAAQNKPTEDVPSKKDEIAKDDKKRDNNLTISTKHSTEQLICKTPQDSPNLSLRSETKRGPLERKDKSSCFNYTLYLGILQIVFGMLMSVFGVLVIVHGANLSHVGGGLWGGCLAVATGTAGVLAAAKDCCPLKRTAQHIAHTVFLALSLISIAVAQLVLVFAATGLARDLSRSDRVEDDHEGSKSSANDDDLPSNYSALLSNIGLLLVSAVECVCAAIASYQGARAICPCFRSEEETHKYDTAANPKHAFVSSWLGKQSPAPFYVVAAPPTIGKHSKLSGGLPITPIFTLPQPMMSPPSMVGYPLITAPMPHMPSLMHSHSHGHTKEYVHPTRMYTKDRPLPTLQRQRCKSRSRSKSKERPMTTEEVAKTYTGLDRVIAEEFIEICDSRNNSLCSESSCQSCCQCSSQATCNLCASGSNTGSDVNSKECLVDNNKSNS